MMMTDKTMNYGDCTHIPENCLNIEIRGEKFNREKVNIFCSDFVLLVLLFLWVNFFMRGVTPGGDWDCCLVFCRLEMCVIVN